MVMAIEDAVKRGAHVLNLSLGDTSGDPLSPEAIAVNNAMLAGTVVCCAAGNSGPAPATVGSPGSADLVITVGASTDDAVTATYAHVSAGKHRLIETRLLRGSAPLPSPAQTLPYVHCGQGRDAIEFPDAVRGNIALIQRGSVTFRLKARNAQAAGAAAVVIYNNHMGNFWGTIGDNTPADPAPTIPVVSIAQADGQALVTAGAQPDGTSNLRLQLDPTQIPIPDRLAEFSSRGPSQNLMIKPELCAPGVNIFSATIQAGPPGLSNMADPSGYTEASGTSMATPHIAGASALLRQLHPDWSPFWIKAALVNTCHWMDKQGRVQDQGNGRVQLLPAATATALLVTDGAAPQPALSFGTVHHRGALASLTASLRLVDVSQLGGTYRLGARLEHRARGLSVAISQRQLTLAPECHAGLQLTLTINGRLLVDGAYSGFVTATGRGGAHLRLPFFLTTVGSGARPPASPGAHSGGLCWQ